MERPAVGSAFPDGQMPLELFLRVVHEVGSWLEGEGCDGVETWEMVDEEEEDAEVREDCELER